MPGDCQRSFDDPTNAIKDFHSTLSLGLKKLEELLGTDFISIDWVQQAVDLLRSSHASVLSLVERLHLQLPIAAKGEELINTYMDETMKLLDVCNALKSGISMLEELGDLAEMVVVSLREGITNTGQLERAIEALDACKAQVVWMDRINRQLVDKIDAEGRIRMNIDDAHVGLEHAHSSESLGVIYPMRNASSFISKLLLWGILHVGSSRNFDIGRICSESSWALSIYNLHQSMSKHSSLRIKQQRREIILLQEFGHVHISLENLSSQVKPLRERGLAGNGIRMSEVKKLSVNSEVLKCGLEALKRQLDDLFDEIVQGRRRMLSILRQSSSSGKV